MPKRTNPRHGSMQFWPRKRASGVMPRVRSWKIGQEPNLSGFIGYKVGMCHVMAKDTLKSSLTKGDTISVPATILECPPMRIAAARVYAQDEFGNNRVINTIVLSSDKVIKHGGFKPLSKASLSSNIKKLQQITSDSSSNAKEIRLVVFSNISKGFLSRKVPLFLEVPIAKDIQSAVSFISDKIDKDIKVSDVFSEGGYADVHGITKGKGVSGPVKRFGISIRAKKSEKTKRGPGSLGPWTGEGPVMYRVAHAGQMGFFQRVDYNKYILKIDSDPNKINNKSGFHRYGKVKHEYLLIKGSVQGPAKRPIVLSFPIRIHPTKEKFKVEVKEVIV
jgi:large subunit ribosomal protein L3